MWLIGDQSGTGTLWHRKGFNINLVNWGSIKELVCVCRGIPWRVHGMLVFCLQRKSNKLINQKKKSK
jgi:hypothetical protein